MGPKTAGIFEGVFVENGAWIWLQFSPKGTQNKCCFLHASKGKRLPADKCRISKKVEKGALLEMTRTAPAAEQAAVPASSNSIAVRT